MWYSKNRWVECGRGRINECPATAGTLRQMLMVIALAALAALFVAPSVGAQTSGKANAPKLGIGQKCFVGSECASGICGAWDPGIKGCLPPDGSAGPGELCSTNEHCKTSYYCMKHRCDRPLEIGQPCSGNASCLSGYCDEGLGSGGTQKCVPPAGTGKPGQYCSQEAHCASKLCTVSKCEAPRPAGGLCAHAVSCDTGQCDIGPTSAKTGKCIPKAGTGTEGQYCSRHVQCQAHFCSENKCPPLADLGQPCPGGNAHCKSRFCDAGGGSGGTNKCVPPVGTGNGNDYCSQNAHCRSKICSANKCVGMAALGQTCPYGNTQCLSGFCDAGGGSGGTNKCVPPAGTGKPGDYCSQNGHCKPGKSCTAHKCQ